MHRRRRLPAPAVNISTRTWEPHAPALLVKYPRSLHRGGAFLTIALNRPDSVPPLSQLNTLAALRSSRDPFVVRWAHVSSGILRGARSIDLIGSPYLARFDCHLEAGVASYRPGLESQRLRCDPVRHPTWRCRGETANRFGGWDRPDPRPSTRWSVWCFRRDSNPCSQRERLVSLARLDDGNM